MVQLVNPRQSNGHRRRELVKRVLQRDSECALCGRLVDKSLTVIRGQHSRRCRDHSACAGCVPHPLRPEVDEDVPVSRGGSPYSLSNCALMHRSCNQWKSNLTLDEAKVKLRRLRSRPPLLALERSREVNDIATRLRW